MDVASDHPSVAADSLIAAEADPVVDVLAVVDPAAEALVVHAEIALAEDPEVVEDIPV